MSILEDAAELRQGSREVALAGAALVLAGLALTPLCVTLARRFAPKGQVFFARWRFLHVALVAVFLAVAARTAPSFVGAFLAPEQCPEGLRALLASVLAFGASACLILWFAARLDPHGIQSLGLRAPGSARAALVGVGCYLLLVPGLYGLQLLWPWLLEGMGRAYEPQAIATQIGELSGSARYIAGGLVIFVMPFLEELVFRGFLQPLFVQNLGDRGGVFLASLSFAVLHGDSAFLPIFGLALLLGSLELRTERLAACFAVHALHNAVVLAFLGGPHAG